jgi:subtilisin family serine protease
MTQAQGGANTGRYLVVLREGAEAEAAELLSRVAAIRTVTTVDVAGGAGAALLASAEGVLLQDLGIAIVSVRPDRIQGLLREAGQGPILAVEPERVVYALSNPTPAPAPAPAPIVVDESEFTWGLQAVRAPQSPATGAGIRVAVLDTGFDTGHPDFAGRTVVTSSFVDGEPPQDGHGHGTHCIGTACGPRTPETRPGYGLAYEAEIYAGKVLNNQGSGADGGILAGIAWAIGNGCPVVSMSLGAPPNPGAPYSAAFEQAATRALAAGTLIVAAAGNESDRAKGIVRPVGHPANCPSIMAIGAIDVNGAIANFSSGTVDEGGAVDLAGPGVDIYSSWPMPTRYRRISGTSMATPHAAGVAALTAQQYGSRGWELWARLGQHARRLPLPSVDVGDGLVQAP